MKKLLFSLLLFPSLLLGQFSGPSDSDTSDREAGASLVWLGTPSNASESVSNIRVGDTIVLGIKISSYTTSKTSIDYAHIDVQIDKRLYTYQNETFNTEVSNNTQFVGDNSKMQWSNNHDHYDIWDQWQNGSYVSDTNYEIRHFQTSDTSVDGNEVETLDWYVKFQLKVNAFDEAYDYTDGVVITMGRTSVVQSGAEVLLDPLYAYPNQDFSNEPVQADPTFVSTVNDGQNAIKYKSFKINDYASNGDVSEYDAHPTNSAGFDAMFDYGNKKTTTWTHQGRDTATKAFTWPWSNILPRHANDNFGWIIEGYFVPPTSGTYKFRLNSDDRSDLWFDANDDGTITNTGIGLGNGARDVDITNLTAGVSYKFRVRYEQGVGGANLKLLWKSPEDIAAGADWAFNANSIYSIDADDVTVTMDYTVNYNIDPDITATDFSVKTYYESGTNQFTANTGQSAVTLSSNGSADISDQIDTDFSKVQHIVFDEPSSTELATTAAAAVTVADVYLAFQELTDKGINNNETGNKFTHGIQYVNADIDKDGDFDFDDTFIMLDWLNGGTLFSLTNLSSVMRLIETSAYNSVASTAIGNYTTTSKFPLGLTNGTTTYTKNITVSWLGDVNLSHSPTPTNNLSVTGMTIGNAPSMTDKRMYITNAETIELRIESEVKDGKIHYRVRGIYGGTSIGAIQLQLKYNKDKVQLLDNIFQTGGTDFVNDQDGIISFGSLKIDDGTLNNLSTYEFIFTGESTEGSLGLILIETIEAITIDNKPVNILFQ
tara:strand:+ start:79 stop:2388 length:2310 start_codon:yes stop_codon:yes gene_type:complete